MVKKISSFNVRIGKSPFLLVSDHAGKAFPEKLGKLGLPESDQHRHIAYDIGIKEVGRELAAKLDATLIEQYFSRLVVDCNRQPKRKDSIPETSDGSIIPGNQGLSETELQWRHENISKPYHNYIADLLQERLKQKIPTLFVSLHSFTPKLKTSEHKRPWEIGLLFNHDPETTVHLEEILLRKCPELCIGKNKPYFMDLAKEYTVPTHAGGNNLPSLEIEIRQDLLAKKEKADFITDLLYQSFVDLEKQLWG